MPNIHLANEASFRVEFFIEVLGVLKINFNSRLSDFEAMAMDIQNVQFLLTSTKKLFIWIVAIF